MSHRIALTSSDGIVINQHFGHAETFHIFELTETDWRYLETRKIEACCQNFDHSDESFDRVLELLSDCEAVFAAKIGIGASEYLIRRGMKVFQATGPISEVLNEVIKENWLDE